MPAFDLPLDQLRDYRPERAEPADFDAFWAMTLAESRALATAPVFEPTDARLRTVQVFDVTFSGYGGQPIRGWLLAPRAPTGPLPTVVEYIGYGGGRSFPFQWLPWSSAGYAHLVVDTRGQGSAWSPGDTPDIEDRPATGQYPGFTTKGIDDPRTYYYRRLITDGVLAIDAAAAHPLVDPERIVVTGKSQGGGVALAVAGLSGRVRAAAIDVPFLCHWRRAVEVTDEHPYREIRHYVSTRREQADRVFATLAYFDGMQFAARAKAPAIFSVGLMDEITPAVDGLRRVQPLRRAARDPRLAVQRPRGREAAPARERFAFLEGLGLAP